ncbi:hypothetical protein [Weizmannia acidilactici]|uniref:hypothetical protein n=1 Tax=Weizmannia acidilactici TaxID=2607726 RepID=UPI0012829D8C|nr:hypothetical protein [Weizmannia acidilactici]GER73401.1 hypothetical protein BpPP18_14680 [Weizmannia acidilactici]
MSGQAVFEQMKAYYLKEIYKREIVSKYDVDSVIYGLLMFNQYLDDHRKEVG